MPMTTRGEGAYKKEMESKGGETLIAHTVRSYNTMETVSEREAVMDLGDTSATYNPAQRPYTHSSGVWRKGSDGERNCPVYEQKRARWKPLTEPGAGATSASTRPRIRFLSAGGL